VRSCYRSGWRLFRDHPEFVTPGRYVVAPPGTPHHATPHNLWSPDWVSDELDPYPALGPAPGVARPYDAGQPGQPFPPATPIGGPDCFRFGQSYPLPVLSRTLAGGWDSRCYAPTPPSSATVDVQDCHFQQWYAELVVLTYDGDFTSVANHVQSRYPGATIAFAPNTESVYPGSAIVTFGQTTIVAISGTQNFQQWALQVLGAGGGPVVFDGYGTVPLWRDASDVIRARMTALGTPDGGHVVFGGHSYGGAVASILAARFQRAQPGRRVSLITEGCPRIGDDALITLLANVDQIAFCNVDDVVTLIPPRGDDLGAVAWLLTAQQVAAWNRWRAPPNRVSLSASGQRLGPPGNPSGFRLLLQFVAAWVAGVQAETLSAHFYTEYARRLRCPNVPSPSPDPGIQPVLWLRPDTLPPDEPGDSLPYWPDASLFPQTVEQANPSAQPTVAGTAIAGRTAVFTFDRYLGHQNLPLGDAWAVYGVAALNLPFGDSRSFRLWGTFDGSQVLLRVSRGFVAYVDPLRTYSAFVGVGGTGLRFYGVRKYANLLWLYCDSNTFGPFSPSGNVLLAPDTVGRVSAAFGAGQQGTLAELRAYVGNVSDDQHQSITDELLERFGL